MQFLGEELQAQTMYAVVLGKPFNWKQEEKNQLLHLPRALEASGLESPSAVRIQQRRRPCHHTDVVLSASANIPMGFSKLSGRDNYWAQT